MPKQSESASMAFAREMQALREDCGLKAQQHAYIAFSETAKLFREHGHAKVTLSAIDHILSKRIKAELFLGPKR